MGTASSKKFIKQNSGVLTEEAALVDSAGVADANRIPALNSSGVLDPTIVNSKTSSAGAGDSGKLPALDASGRLDSSFMPSGIGADTKQIEASEALAAGDLVNIHDSTGPRCRKADATTQGKRAHGFVLSAVTLGAMATVYFEGANTAVTGLTAGDVYLSTTAGLPTNTPPSASGNLVQPVGVAVSTTEMNFEAQRGIVLA